jgi:hypothetical protein
MDDATRGTFLSLTIRDVTTFVEKIASNQS